MTNCVAQRQGSSDRDKSFLRAGAGAKLHLSRGPMHPLVGLIMVNSTIFQLPSLIGLICKSFLLNFFLNDAIINIGINTIAIKTKEEIIITKAATPAKHSPFKFLMAIINEKNKAISTKYKIPKIIL